MTSRGQVIVQKWVLTTIMLVALQGGAWVTAASAPRTVLEDFQHHQADGFPANWENESARNEARARESYKVRSENREAYLTIRNADQRIKKKKLDWDPKANPVLTWRWRLQKAPQGSDPIAVLYVALDTDLLFIPVFTKYVWSGTRPEGTVTEGGMFSGTEVVVESGTNRIGEWVEERVNVYEDFKRIHKHEPAPKAWGISLFAGPGVEVDIGPITASSN